MQIERCKCCNGQKIIMGMGMIEKKCFNCNGVGHVNKELNTETIEKIDIEKVVKNVSGAEVAVIVKRRGRPKAEVFSDG
jgi:hypothetical protein